MALIIRWKQAVIHAGFHKFTSRITFIDSPVTHSSDHLDRTFEGFQCLIKRLFVTFVPEVFVSRKKFVMSAFEALFTEQRYGWLYNLGMDELRVYTNDLIFRKFVANCMFLKSLI